jgi:hypothetical protein
MNAAVLQRGLLGLMLSLPAMAQPHRNADPDWPCVQRLVPRISATALWPGPGPGPGPEVDWRSEPDIREIVDTLSQRSLAEAEGAAAIAAFTARLDAAERRRLLPLVFAGLLEATNFQRDMLIEQIRRFTRRQRDLAERARAAATELRLLPETAPDERRAELEQRRFFTAKAFEDAERTLRFACEAPVRLEGRLGGYARALAGALPPD